MIHNLSQLICLFSCMLFCKVFLDLRVNLVKVAEVENDQTDYDQYGGNDGIPS